MKPVAMTLAPFDTLAELRFERDVRRLHQLGERAVGELLRELGEARSCRMEIDRRLQAYARLDPRTVRALDACHFPPAPIHEVA